MDSLGVVVLTNKSDFRLKRLLDWVESRPYIAMCYGFIDIRHSTRDEQDAIAEAFSTRGVTWQSVDAPNIDAALAYCHSSENIRTEWALHIGTDELMGSRFDADIERLMQGPYDVYSLPRYNLIELELDGAAQVPNNIVSYQDLTSHVVRASHISSDPWYPDWAQRLFRPGHLIHHGEVHEGAAVVGRQAMAGPHIFHFDFIDESREEREVKWQRYLEQGVVEASKARGLPEDYYKRWCLPEDFEYQTELCREELQ